MVEGVPRLTRCVYKAGFAEAAMNLRAGGEGVEWKGCGEMKEILYNFRSRIMRGE